MISLAVFVGAFIVKGLNIDWRSLIYGFVTAFTFNSASMAINDYCDREIDSINAPYRPIPSGVVKPLEAIIIWVLLTIMGFIAAYLTSMECLLLASVAWVLFVVYSTKVKALGLIGNVVVSLCVSIPFIYGSLLAAGKIELQIAIFAVMAFLANMGREVTKGILDIEGDKAKGIKTVAVSYGPKIAALLAGALYLSSVILSVIPWLLHLVSLAYLPPILLSDLGFLYSTVSLRRYSSKRNIKNVKNSVLIWMFLGLIGFMAGSLNL